MSAGSVLSLGTLCTQEKLDQERGEEMRSYKLVGH